ncbi:MAG: hypothetical protein H0Z55_00395 [Nitrosarchaeum sp.]|nr:hypothetical protein [Nitrosarchaeum sp.]
MLDINTPRGQETLIHEKEAVEIFHRWWGKTYTYQPTDKSKPIAFDAYLMQGETRKAIVETKCRSDMDYRDFVTQRHNLWLITEDKLERCAKIAGTLNIPLYGFLYFVKCRTLLVIRLSEKNGRLLPHKSIKTKTTATINGGQLSRLNAFIDMTHARKMI